MSVYKRGKRWTIDVKVKLLDGTSTRVRQASPVNTAKGAREHEHRVRQAIVDGTWRGGQRKVERITVANFAPRFLEYQRRVNRASDYRLKEQVLRQHVVPDFGDLYLDQVTTRIVDAYRVAKLSGLRANTVANHVTTIKRMLRVAHDWGLLEKVPTIRQVKRDRTDADFLDFEEADRFIAHTGQWRCLVLVAIRTGLRLGELRGLQWGDIELDGPQERIRVARAFTKDGWVAPKSGKGRTVELAWDAADELRRHRPADASRTALVFPGPAGAPLDEKAVYNACKGVSSAANLGRTISPHKLRHTFASHHAMRGTPMPLLQQWMGHASLTTTMRYSHLCPGAGAEHVDRIAPQRPLRVAEVPNRGHHGGTAPPTDHENAV